MLVVTPKFEGGFKLLASDESHKIYLEKKNKLIVAQAMVREDIWQALLEIDPIRVKELKQQARDMCEKIQDDRSNLRLTFRLEGNMVWAWIREQFCIGHESHYQLFLDRNPTEDELSRFLDTIAETVFIQSILSSTRYQYRPSTSVGPQFGEWNQHVAFLKALTGVAEQCYAAEQEDLDDGSESSI